MKKHFKKILAMMIVLCMVFSLFPASTLAAEVSYAQDASEAEMVTEETASDIADANTDANDADIDSADTSADTSDEVTDPADAKKDGNDGAADSVDTSADTSDEAADPADTNTDSDGAADSADTNTDVNDAEKNPVDTELPVVNADEDDADTDSTDADVNAENPEDDPASVIEGEAADSDVLDGQLPENEILINEEDENGIDAQSVSIEKKLEKPLDTSIFYRIFHLDAGRKYFTVDQIEGIIDTLSDNNYTHLELVIGNDALRFILDDMSVTVDETQYAGDKVTAGIKKGNSAYYDDPNGNALTEDEMNAIFDYADQKGISIIPLLNTPGHMDSIIDCMEYLGISNPAYQKSTRTIDVTNDTAVAFTLALANKYIEYFAGKGCTIFNMGCDEYANDVTNGFSALQSAGKYGKFIEYVNNMAAQVQNAGMTPMAFNDGIYYNNDTNSGTFDTNIVIAYWTSGWSGYSPRSAAKLTEDGFKIINTNDAWYYVLGRTSGSYALSSAQKNVQETSCTSVSGSNSVTPAGCMICLWCDAPEVSYNETEQTNVKGLISTLAVSNSDYFNVGDENDGSGTVEGETERTVELVVGETAKDIIKGVKYSGEYTTENTGIAEIIEVTGGTVEDIPGIPASYDKATSITNGNSYIIGDGTQWLVLNGSSLSSTTDPSQATSWTVTSQYNYAGYTYTIKSGNYYLRHNNNSLSAGTSYGNWNYSSNTGFYYTSGQSTYYLRWSGSQWQVSSGTSNIGAAYTYTAGTETVKSYDYTEVTFKGVSAGTTYATIGDVKYTIRVSAKDLSQVSPQRVELWITNYGVESTDSNVPATQFNTGDSSRPNGYYVSVSAQEAYDENGIALSEAVPATGKYAWSSDLVFWKGTRLTSGNEQTASAGSDQTAAGNDFTYIRYYNDAWEFSGDRETWTSIADTDQIVAYYLQRTEVTSEIDTLAKDWGYHVGEGDNNPQVALSVAVVYPDGTVSPDENGIYNNCTTMFNYWDNRDIGIVAPVNNSDYDIEKITVTAGTRKTGSSNIWSTSDGIDWEKTTNAAGNEWYAETTYWDDSMATTPMVNGATSGITWPGKNTAYLVLIYLKPVHHETNLNVRWVDDSAGGALIHSQEVVVDYTGSEVITFYNGLKQTSDLPTEGVGGTFTLDDNAYITNSSNVNQTFNKDLTTMKNIAGQYTSGLYGYVGAELSPDGKTLTLHYKLNNADFNYVVDFGLPVQISLNDLGITSTTNIKSVTTTSNASYADGKITYTPSQALNGTETVTVRVEYTSGNPTTHSIGFMPATTVYYEEGFASYSENWTDTGSKGSSTQATEKAGEKTNNYGYDSAYNLIGASNGTQATTSTKGASATFTFTGTGIDIYANCTTVSGTFLIQIKNDEGITKKILTANTIADGSYGVLVGDQSYNTVIASVEGLPHDTYTVKLTSTTDKVVNLDGFRAYGTLADMANETYKSDAEDSPSYIELRDLTLTALGAEAGETAPQVYAKADGKVDRATVVYDSSAYTPSDLETLLSEGPKNELFLQKGQSLVIKVTTDRQIQIGLKAVNGTVKVNGSYSGTLTTSTDMFYTVPSGIITITNDSSSAGVLSVTKLKICDDPNAALSSLTEEDLIPALESLGFEEDPGTEEPDPEPAYADAALTVAVNDADGNVLATTTLTANGIEGESAVFNADDIKAAVEGLALPEDYKLEEAAYSDVTVAYGESDNVTFKAVKEEVVEPTPTPDPEPTPDPTPEKPGSGLSKIWNSVKSFFQKIFGR